MELESLTCNNCGAPLKVPESANFVKCNHCSTQLAIRRTESTTFTEQLGEITKKTDEIKQVVTELARQNKVAAIDRQWDREKEQFMIAGKDGRRHLPSETGAVFTGVAFGVVGIIWCIAAFSSGSPMGVFGVVVVIIGVVIAGVNYAKAEEYQKAHRRYRQRRTNAARAELFEDDETAGGYLNQLENIRTPDEFLDDLGDQ